MLNLTFNPCFKAKWGHHILKCPDISLFIGPTGSECRNSPWKDLASNVLPVKNFDLMLKNKMAATADCLKIIKML